jgi:hypothetical protein
MKKTFTTKVPNSLYSDDFSENKTATFTYEGPDVINVVIDKKMGNILNRNFVEGDLFDEENNILVTVDAKVDTNIAYLLLNNTITNFIFEDEVLDDGSVYKNRTNPSLHDYYIISEYDLDNKNFKLNSIVRNSKTPALIKAEEIKTTLETGFLARIEIDDGGNDSVKNFLESNGVTLSKSADEIVTEIQNYVTVLDNFIKQESKKVIWKYENPPTSVVPELPDYLKKFF